jgi:hypothetical protein
MKINKKYDKLLLIVWILFAFSCRNESDTISYNHQDGVAPKSVEQVTDVFELKYGDVKNVTYDGQSFQFSISNVVDSMLPCDVYDFSGDPEGYNKARINAFLNVVTDQKTFQSKVSSLPCGGYFYRNDGADIQYVWNKLEAMQSCNANQVDASYFSHTFPYSFGDGTLINNSRLSIYMAKFYPQPDSGLNFDYKKNKNNYKFIFIITNQKIK